MVSEDPADSGSDEVIYEEAENIRRATRPPALTILATIFAGVLIVMIGGLASYYYYTVQSQTGAGTKTISEQWNTVVIATNQLTNSFADLNKFEDMALEGSSSFETALNKTNGQLRDVLYKLDSPGGYSLSGNVFNSRLTTFLDDYIAYLREMGRVIEKGRSSLIKEMKDIDTLKTLSEAMNESYDNLLVADKGSVITTTLSRELFAIASEVEDFVQTYLDEQKTKSDEDDAEKTAANDVTTKFMQAYVGKDVVAMRLYLTPAAEADFQPGAVQEETSEIKSYKIADTRKLSDTKIEIDATLTKETPDGVTVTDKRLFVMLKQSDGKWLIDSYRSV
ncbi:hypothetical protein JXA59_00605 [Patescibacteria group bacterium]|nr:hypothetical protein [Patescibacteria group bacterium]